MPLPPGIFEHLFTAALSRDASARRSDHWSITDAPSEDTLRPELLARYLHTLTRRTLAALPGDPPEKRDHQIALANQIIATLRDAFPASRSRSLPILDGDTLDAEARLLLEARPPAPALSDPKPTPRPHLPLASSGLLVNSHRDYQVGAQLPLEIASADRIDLLCAFVRFAGLRLVRQRLADFVDRGGQLRVIASVYTGSTEKRALDELAALGAQIKISYETTQTRLHAKAWLFHRATGLSTAYIGSSNLTHSALVDGLEWNVRLSQVDNADIVERVAATFEQYWSEPEFVDYEPTRDGAQLECALSDQRSPRRDTSDVNTLLALHIDLAPKPFQEDILQALEVERQHGHMRNLVVAATGTGKTWVSAFDYRRLREQGHERLLFVAHRDEILRQSQAVFQLVIKDASFGERLVRGERPTEGRHVFASVQSLTRRVDELDPRQFDVVIVDEFHHAAAPTYERLLERLEPQVLLGLTATPERADGQSVLGWFDGRIASEMRLWQALEQALLCPFHYFGVHDGTDLSSVAFKRGRYAVGELDNLYTGDDLRVIRILEAVRSIVHQPSEMRALGFCVGVGHAQLMAQRFSEAGLPSVALHADSPDDERRGAVQQLRRGEICAIFTVDLFNEGVDIPEVDTVLMLRPTESATVFLQQLGRGLRWADSKSVLTVLDFIGQAHRDFRFDVRYRALLGGTRKQIERAVEGDFPLLPPGCAIQLDRIAKDKVLANIRTALRNAHAGLLDDLRALGPDTTLPRFIAESGHDLDDLYARPSLPHTFTALRRDAGFLEEDLPVSPKVAKRLGTALGRMLHVDDQERLEHWQQWLRHPKPPRIHSADTREGRLQLMLFAALQNRRRPIAELGAALDELWQAPAFRQELADLLELLQDRVRSQPEPLDPDGKVPLCSHATYRLFEVIGAYARTGHKGSLIQLQTGVYWVEEESTDLLFITLEKSEAAFSPTTRYEDYPISRTRFHWESQNTTSESSPTGQRYLRQAERGSQVLLFVRERPKDPRGETLPYLCLGRARYVSHESERPMRIVWKLERPMPAWFYQVGKVAAA